MNLKILSFATLIFVIACGLLPSQPTQEATISPTTTPNPTAALQQPTLPVIQPTTEPVDNGPTLFRDEFDESLLDGWTWTREDPDNWSLAVSPGSLQIDVGPGHVHDETISNLLLRDAPAGDFQIETKIIFTPSANFQFAGLIIFESPSNVMLAGRAFCEGGFNCVGDGIYIDYYKDGEFILPNFAQPYNEGNTLVLRLIRTGTQFTLQTSPDGNNWTLRGGHESDLNPLQIGLVAGQNESGPIPALFEYFEVRSAE